MENNGEPSTLTCIKCGSQDKLSFTMFRNNGRLVGFLCACTTCQDEIAGGAVSFSWSATGSGCPYLKT